MSEPLLEVRGLGYTFPARRTGLRRSTVPVHAVDDVSFDVLRAETFGIVGESGSGKSTLARCLLRLLEPTAGQVRFDGIDLETLAPEELRRLRRRLQIVFQDATAALDSRLTVRAALDEPLRAHDLGDRTARRERADRMLERVGIPPALAERRPHAFSGGQRQRIAIARALALEPDLVVLDEPVSAVDVSVQAQILTLLAELQAELGLTYVLIVHDLSVAAHACDRIAVLYLGRVMELAPADTLFTEALHPYTVSLLSAVPVPDPVAEAERERIVLRGEVPARPDVRRGCPFEARCPVGAGRALCREQRPPLVEHAPGHLAACHFPGELRTP